MKAKHGQLALAWALGLVLPAFAGCGNQSGTVDPAYGPAGVASGNAVLLADVQPLSADSSQIEVDAIVFDNTAANGYRAYLSLVGQGFEPASDYTAAPTKVYSTGWETYRMPIQAFHANRINILVARGSVNGIESFAAPVTNLATVPGLAAVELARRVDVPLVAPADSDTTARIWLDGLAFTPNLRWAAVPGAANYLLQITGRGGLTYLALTSRTQHRVRFDPATRFEDVLMRTGFEYKWSVFALDDQNRLIGHTVRRRALIPNRAP